MPHRIVAASALQTFSFAVDNTAVDFCRDVLVTPAAGVLGNSVVELGDLNRVGIVATGEIKGMPETVIGLHRIFANEVVRGVAIVAGGRRMMARLHPGFVLCLHDVTVGTSLGIVC